MTKKVVSLFDGASCAQEALRNIDVKADYFSSEIDAYAMKITMKNFPNTKQIGDITKLRNGDLPKDVFLLIGGSPCQGLSTANNMGRGLEDERSALFWRFVEILDRLKPRYFVLENVRPRFAADQAAMTNAMGVHPILLDSQNVSAQRRKRLFWTNIPNVKKPHTVPSRIYPDNKIGLVIADILEPDAQRRIVKVAPERLIKTSYGVRWNGYQGGQQSQNANDVAVKGKTVDTGIGRKYGYNIVRGSNYGLQGNYAVKMDGKHNALQSSNLKGNCNVVVDHNSQQYRAFDANLKHGTLPSVRTTSKTNVVFDGLRIEQLTWTEIERLMGMPDGFTDLGEDNRVEHRGRAIGNGFQINVVAHLLSFMKGNPKPMRRNKNNLLYWQVGLFEKEIV